MLKSCQLHSFPTKTTQLYKKSIYTRKLQSAISTYFEGR